MTRDEILAGWAATDFLTPERADFLEKLFGDLETAFFKIDAEILKKNGVPTRSANVFCQKRDRTNPAEIWEKCQKVGAKILFFRDKNFPELLKKIDGAPAILFFRGQNLKKDEKCFAVVGTRKISNAGKIATEKIVPPLVRAGLTIVSGLARGVDAAAHRATVAAGGRTIAVLGNGIDDIYPPENRGLARNLLENGGTILSEFPPGAPPNAFHFPRRNRIVSGLSLGALIVEGAEKSGSLITAQLALDQNREVFAIPGAPNAPFSRGPNRLIQSGAAKLTLDADDILAELPLEKIDSQNAVKKAVPTDATEKKVFELLTDEPQLFDEIIRKSDLPAATFSATLTILEMKGFAVNFSGNFWARR